MNPDVKTILDRLCDLKDQLLISYISFCETRIIVISLARPITLKLLLVEQIQIPPVDYQKHSQIHISPNHRKGHKKDVWGNTRCSSLIVYDRDCWFPSMSCYT